MSASPPSDADRPSAVVSVPSDFADEKFNTLGVTERRTYRCYVGFDVEPSLLPDVRKPSRLKRRLLLLREFGYLALSRLERLRRRFRPLILPAAIDSPQYAYHGLSGKVASRVLLPSFARDSYRLSSSLAELDSRAWFETSRRTVDFNPDTDPYGRHFQMVCYMFAPDKRDAIERLFSWHINQPPANEMTTVAYDRETDFIFRSRFLRRVAARRFRTRLYFEITIVPRDRIIMTFGDREQFALPILDRAFPELTPELQADAISDTLVSELNEHRDSPAIHIIARAPEQAPIPSRVAFDTGYSERANLNREFILSAIETAKERGQALDEEFVREAARKQVVFANRTHDFTHRPGAGATQETAEVMVGSMVDLYRLANGGEASPKGDC